jgi:hypothetical protein|tara:strand:- start:99 stop:521 length:423 start_codon:yes stop_codon:yes gene_type:complete
MIQTSIKQVVENIKVIAQTLFPEIAFVDFAKYHDKGLEKEGVRLVYSLSDSMSFNMHTDLFSLDFEMLDLLETLQDPDERILEVTSDTRDISSSFVDYLKKNGYYFQDSVSVTKVDKKYKDGLGGVAFTLDFNLAKTCLV